MKKAVPSMYVVQNCPRDVTPKRVKLRDNVIIEYIHADILSIKKNIESIQSADLVLMLPYPDAPIFGWPRKTTEIAEFLYGEGLITAELARSVPDYEIEASRLAGFEQGPSYGIPSGVAPDDLLKGVSSAALFAHRLLSLTTAESKVERKHKLYASIERLLKSVVAPSNIGKHRDVLIAEDCRRGLISTLLATPGVEVDMIEIPFDKEVHVSDILLNAINLYREKYKRGPLSCERVEDFVRRLDLPKSEFISIRELSRPPTAIIAGVVMNWGEEPVDLKEYKDRWSVAPVGPIDKYLLNSVNQPCGVVAVQGGSHYAFLDLQAGHLTGAELRRIIVGYVKKWTSSSARIEGALSASEGKSDVVPERRNPSSFTGVTAQAAPSASTKSTDQDKKSERTQPKTSQPTSATKTEPSAKPRELVLMGPKNEIGKCRVSVDGTIHELIDSVMTKILALAIAKLCVKEGEFPGIRADKENSLGFKLYKKLAVTDIRRIVMEARKGLCGLDRDASTDDPLYKKDVVVERKPRDAVRVPGQALPCGYEIAWSAKEIIIAPLLDYLKNSNLAISPVFGELVALYQKRK